MIKGRDQRMKTKGKMIAYWTVTLLLAAVEAMHMIKKEQIDLRDQSVQNQKEFIHRLFGITA